MTQEQIIEGNRLIAEFMGLSIIKDEPLMKVSLDEYDDTLFFCEWHPNLKVKDFNIMAWNWEPNKEWCQLMPVVEKIEACCHGFIQFIIKDHRAYIELGTQGALAYDIESVPDCYSGFCTAKIEATYSTVCQFITWYNTQTP